MDTEPTDDDKIKQILTKIHARREIMQELVRANIKDRNEIRELEAASPGWKYESGGGSILR